MGKLISKLKTIKKWGKKKTTAQKGIIALSPNNRLFENDSSSDFFEYEGFLESAFKNNRVRNLAITGNHGIGKSSIIRSFETKDKNHGKGYLYISLMDFNNNRGAEYAHVKQEDVDSAQNRKQLQQEFERYLLCQILSRVDAQSLPHSTFRLIPSNKKKSRTMLALLIAIIALCVFGIAFSTAIGISSLIVKILYYVCWGICTMLIFTATFILSRTITTTKFTASYGGMKVETQNQKTTGSYIDDHIYEIVYALETMASDIGHTVVLEDMDRLGRSICVDIFSKLRRINYLVNDRKKLKGKYIRFIYAFDDSVFELTKNTKFFDYVMSVTPKLNYNTGGKYFKDLILKSLPDENSQPSGLKDIIEQYDYQFWEHVGMVVHNYRMLNHIRNDFQLFVNIMSKRNFKPNNKWLPFVIYKNVLAEDYCNAFEQKGILELDKDKRNQKIEKLCSEKGDNYSELVKLLFEYIIDEIQLSSKDFQQFTGLPQKVIDARNISNEYSAFKEILNPKIEPNQEILNELLSGKKVLVTGGAGSIGSEICRQIANYDIESLIIVDISENNSYEIQQELLTKKIKNNFALHIEIASIRDVNKIDDIFKKYQPNIVIHSAAHKHVPLMENNPEEAIKNNIIGTYNVVTSSEKHKVEKFILVSTDKAVNPTNVMGATKRFCELLISSRKTKDTVFCAVRFGNVLGSNGSVIPLFRKQIENGGPITITHKDMIRYFMTIPEACQLILQSGAIAHKSEVFVLDMGTPVRIRSLAENIIRLHGLKPYEDIDIVETGLRPGEKLYEELLISEESLGKTEIERVYIDSPGEALEKEKIDDVVFRLIDGIDKNVGNKALMEMVKEIVPMHINCTEDTPEIPNN